MAYRWSTYRVEFLGGMETKVDAKAVGGQQDTADKVIKSKLLRLENGQFIRPGAIVKRPINTAVDLACFGSTVLAPPQEPVDVTIGVTDVPRVRGFFKRREQEVLLDGNRLWTRSRDSTPYWVDQGALSTMTVDMRQSRAVQPKIWASVNGVSLGRREDYFVLMNQETKDVLAEHAMTVGLTDVLDVVTVSDIFIWVLCKQSTSAGTQMLVYLFNTEEPETAPTTHNVFLNTNTDHPTVDLGAMKLLADGVTVAFVLQNSDVGTDVAFGVGTFDGETGDPVAGPDTYATSNSLTTVGGLCELVISINSLGEEGLNVFWTERDSGNLYKLYFASFDANLTPVIDAELVGDFTGTTDNFTVRHFIGLNNAIDALTTTASVDIFFGMTTPDDTNHVQVALSLMHFNIVLDPMAVVVDAKARQMPGLAPASHCWTYNDRVYFVAKYNGMVLQAASHADSDWQPTYFVMCYDPETFELTIQGRFLESQAVVGQDITSTSATVDETAHPAAIRLGVFEVALLSAEEGNNSGVIVTFDFTNQIEAVEFGDSLFIAAGMLFEFDGHEVYEAGFHLSPDDFDIDLDASGGLDAGLHTVAVCFVFTTQTGRVYRSAVSPLKQVTLGASDSITFLYPLYNITNRRDARVQLEVYLSQAANSSVLRLHSTLEVLYEQGGDYQVTASQLTAYPDADARLLYTTGGVVDNEPPPPLRSLAVRGRRLFGAGIDGTVRFTKEIVAGEGVALFSDGFNKPTDTQEYGPFSIAEMDSAIYAFTRFGIHGFNGAGPDDAGVGTFSDWQPVNYGAPGRDPVSPQPLAAERGVWFFQEGIPKVLLRQGQVSDVGLSMSDEAGRLLLTACQKIVYRDDLGQVWFLCTGADGDVILVFDLLMEQWSLWTYDTTNGWTGFVRNSSGAFLAQATGLLVEA